MEYENYDSDKYINNLPGSKWTTGSKYVFPSRGDKPLVHCHDKKTKMELCFMYHFLT